MKCFCCDKVEIKKTDFVWFHGQKICLLCAKKEMPLNQRLSLPTELFVKIDQVGGGPRGGGR
jgi:hypothetical protein